MKMNRHFNHSKPPPCFPHCERWLYLSSINFPAKCISNVSKHIHKNASDSGYYVNTHTHRQKGHVDRVFTRAQPLPSTRQIFGQDRSPLLCVHAACVCHKAVLPGEAKWRRVIGWRSVRFIKVTAHRGTHFSLAEGSRTPATCSAEPTWERGGSGWIVTEEESKRQAWGGVARRNQEHKGGREQKTLVFGTVWTTAFSLLHFTPGRSSHRRGEEVGWGGGGGVCGVGCFAQGRKMGRYILKMLLLYVYLVLDSQGN